MLAGHHRLAADELQERNGHAPNSALHFYCNPGSGSDAERRSRLLRGTTQRGANAKPTKRRAHQGNSIQRASASAMGARNPRHLEPWHRR
eukprot:612312-Alexandrium_andersonii.AAC.1